MADDNVIDLDAERREREPPEPPYMVVEFRNNAPARVVGIPHDPDAIMAAAYDMLNAAVELMTESHRTSGRNDDLPRMVSMLFRSARIRVTTYNGPAGGAETEGSLDWMRASLPYLGDVIKEMRNNATNDQGSK